MRRRRIKYFENIKSLEKDIHFITYGDAKYHNAKKRLSNQSKLFYNFKSINLYGPKDIDSCFYEQHKDILSQPRGGGYWVWKPYFIQKKLQQIEEGDYLIYLDAGCSINSKGFNRFKEYIEMLDNSETPIISFQMSHLLEKWYTNDKIFEYFNIKPETDIGNTGQIVGGIQIIKKCQHTMLLFNNIMDIIEKNPYLFTDKYNNLTTRKNFKDNRHDQSILSITRKIYGSIILEDETYFENPGFGGEKSLKYPFWATRKR